MGKKSIGLIAFAFIMSCYTPQSITTDHDKKIKTVEQSAEYSIETPSEIPNNITSWSDSVLKNLTIRQKVGQLIFPRVYSWYFSQDSKEYVRIKKLITTDEIGGVVVFLGDVFEEATLLNELQSKSKLPLWVMQDSENGLAMRIRNSTLFPHIMTLGAINDTNLTRRVGVAIGKENRAVGVHQVLAPVIDVNNNPSNPVINVRSFGADPDLVSIQGYSMALGIEQGGTLSTLKHFPGHGDTGTDSHVDLPVINFDMPRLTSVELKPYDYLMKRGVSSVMVAHLALPKISGNFQPATLSKSILDSLLFNRYFFKGLVVTDAMEMGAIVKKYGSTNAAILALQAGVNAIILPVGEEQVIDGIVSAIQENKISIAVIDSSVIKILRLKEKFNLQNNRFVNLLDVRKNVATIENQTLAEEVANRSLTLVKNENKLLPFGLNSIKSKLQIIAVSDYNDPAIADDFFKQLKQNYNRPMEFMLLDKRSNALDYEIASRKIKSVNDVLVLTYSNVVSGRGKIGLEQTSKDWLLAQAKEMKNKKSVLVAFGNPYIVNDFNFFNSILITYSISDRSQKASILALTGQIPFEGHLPINLKEYPIGYGITTPKPILTVSSEICKLTDNSFNRVENLVNESILEGVAPAMAIGVINKGQLVYQNSFGNFTYSAESPLVQCTSLWDLASLTKVYSTTLAVMKLYDNKQIDLSSSLTTYFPEVMGTEKQSITIKQLLTHTSGFEAWKPFYKEAEYNKDEIVQAILSTPLKYMPGDSSIYSDWNFILLGEVVRKISGLSIDEYVKQNFYDPLNLKSTVFNPTNFPVDQIVPTEIDSVWRKRLVQGTVHDETAQLMGGVSGHAGLFSSIQDLMKITDMIVNKGTFDKIQFLKKETVNLFSQSQKLNGNRALGWDIRSAKGYKSCGSYFSPTSFGHTGFTGTSVWIDPEKQVAIVLLTNRVYPSRDNRKISDFRPKIHDLIMKALGYSESKN